MGKEMMLVQLQDGKSIRKYEHTRQRLVDGETGFCLFHVHKDGKPCGKDRLKSMVMKIIKKLEVEAASKINVKNPKIITKAKKGASSRRTMDKKQRSNVRQQPVPNAVLEANELARRFAEEVAMEDGA
jgi:hypothetical protein